MASFSFKQFTVHQDKCAMKIGTDGVLLGAWANIAQAPNVLDIGTGTGVLALMAAQRNTTAFIDAIEIDQAAAQQAQFNFENSPWRQRLQVHHISLQKFSTRQKYDAIISNPPYFEIQKSTSIKSIDRQLARTTSALPFRELLEHSYALLSSDGSFSLILPTQEGKVFISLAKECGFYCNKIVEVIPRIGKTPNRLLIELKKKPPTTTQLGKITLRNAGNIYHDYTDDFIALHRDFLLIL